MNDLTDRTSSIVKLFADDTSLFSVVQNNNNSASQLNNGLDKVSDWAYIWRMSFNQNNLSKQARAVIFSIKCTKEDHPSIYFNDISVTEITVQKYIGISRISRIMKQFLIKLRKHNMMQHYQSLVQLEEYLGKNSMLNLALHLSNLGNGS